MSKDSGYLLLVEDEPTLQIMNTELLKENGYSVRQAYTIAEAWETLKNKQPRGIILDIQLPDGNGLDFLRELRKMSSVPVLILTTMNTAEDIVRGLKTGSDEYLTKPYNKDIFLASVESLLRRAETIPEVLEYGSFKLYPCAAVALLDGEDMALSQKEFSILQLMVQQILLQHTEEVLSAEHLYEKVWMQEMVDNKNSLKQAIRKLREKISGSMYTVTNIRGRGYYLEKK